MLLGGFPSTKDELEQIDSKLSVREYMGGALVSFTFYFFFLFSIMAVYIIRNELTDDLPIRALSFILPFVFSSAIFFYTLLFPKWLASKQKLELEKNMLFAVRHLMIQTSAGVPLFDSIVSVSQKYDDEKLSYGKISDEFTIIVAEVKGGKNLSESLEDSARRNPSSYYKRVMWQLSNANQAGANVGEVLSDIVDFLSSEQKIMIKNYGSQLNPLALFYMLVCIIMPTMAIIFLTIASTLTDVAINEVTLSAILIFLIVVQIMYVGLIKSRRPVVSI